MKILNCLYVLIALSIQGSMAQELSTWEDDIFDSELELVADGFEFTEAPVWNPEGFLLFSDIEGDRIYKLSSEGEPEVWREPCGKVNGLAFDNEWRLIACERFGRRITRTEQDSSITVIADSNQGMQFNTLDDCVIRFDGTIFFTDPYWGGDQDLDFQGVFRVKPGEDPVLVADYLDKLNCILLSPDEKTLGFPLVGARETPSAVQIWNIY
jgi:sugar lactone lactonase YvrE